MNDQIRNPFIFMENPYTSKNRLIGAMAANWKEGRKALFSGKISAHFKSMDRSMFQPAVTAENAFRIAPKDGDVIFWKWAYTQGKIPDFFWQGRNYGNTDKVIGLLHDGTEEGFNRLLIMLVSRKLFSVYCKSARLPKSVIENVKYVEKYFNKENSGFKKSKTRTLLYMVLSQERKLSFDSRTFDDVRLFSAYLQGFADISKKKLHNKIQPLFLDEYNLEPGLEGWLLNLGFQHELSLWNDKFQAGFDGLQEEEDGDKDPLSVLKCPTRTLPLQRSDLRTDFRK
ncbi:MAG: hypothetical protein LUF92_14030 [Clostridiales bacterium]|nr:hypothetical protein [Clostridiales bacterium]